MKERQGIRVALVLLYLVLGTRGSTKTIIQWENASEILTYPQVNKTMMQDGDVYDCIDVNRQPALNHPFLKDHKIQMKPSSFPIGVNINSSVLHVASQADLPIVECSTGMVPILRSSRRDQTTSHNTDQFINKDVQIEEAGIRYSDDLHGVQATINVYEPKVYKDSEGYSQTGIQIDNGPMGHLDSITAFYSVSPSYFGDSFARFHVGWRDGVSNKVCFDHNCPGFVQVSYNVGLGGRLQHVSVYNGPQYAIDIFIFKDPKTNNWWLVYGQDKIPLGYWPSSLFTHMKDKGSFSFWGGHVSRPTASPHYPQMGSGHFASEGYGKAAFIGSIQIVDKNNKLVTPNEHKQLVGSSDLRKYTVDGYRVSKDGMHIYYGGPGNFV
ncbi:uncharacterized protein LOC123440950 [Hordeum vulgare subsp. vulgare]|uniref:Neprosin PEP catalytic domain-containing protein n=1 Tax=Hordeum vulgare subsp. vulgare TaxID=112509 RepID=A0A8I6Y2D9_HORVV|nr:uncharacterized protein LOC123440950 [Hordeum vulgare subsp. vulgare]